MTGATGVLIRLGVRLVVFGLAFWVATRRNPRVVIPKKRTLPLVALVFAALNTGLYWLLAPMLKLATLGVAGFATPLVVNLVLLLGTERAFRRWRWFEVQGALTTLWLAALLTVTHGALFVALDFLPRTL